MDAPKAGGILLWKHPGPKNVWRFFPRHSVECVEVVAICPNLAASPRKLAKVVSTTPLLNRWEYAPTPLFDDAMFVVENLSFVYQHLCQKDKTYWLDSNGFTSKKYSFLFQN